MDDLIAGKSAGELKPHTFNYTVQVPIARLKEAARVEDVINEGHALPGCAAALELIRRFGGYLDEGVLEAAAASVPDYMVDYFAEEWIKFRGEKSCAE